MSTYLIWDNEFIQNLVQHMYASCAYVSVLIACLFSAIGGTSCHLILCYVKGPLPV